MKTKRVHYMVLAALWLSGLAAIPFLPAQVPSHWNVVGQVDGYSSPLGAALLVPVLATVIMLLRPLLPLIDPHGERYASFERSYDLILNALLVFFMGLHLVTIGFALGLPLSVPRLLIIGVGLLFAVLGVAIRDVGQNYFVGIRTPWTLADPEVWRRTHQVCGWAFSAVGLVIALAGLAVPLELLFAMVLVGVFGVVLFTIGYSYWVWRQLRGGGRAA